MIIDPKSRLVFIGDSITDCGRKRPVGEGRFNQALGDGYVSLVDAALTANYPDYAIKTINMGISGNTIRDLKARWQRDVLDINPDWLVIKIGINDAWQHFSFGWQMGNLIQVDEYSGTLDQLIEQVRPQLQGLILMTPYVLESDQQEPMRALMDRFGGAVHEAAAKYGAVLVDTQAAYDEVMKFVDPNQLANDKIHANLTGHMILAKTFLASIGFSWERSF